jgi:hypothetical protein
MQGNETHRATAAQGEQDTRKVLPLARLEKRSHQKAERNSWKLKVLGGLCGSALTVSTWDLSQLAHATGSTVLMGKPGALQGDAGSPLGEHEQSLTASLTS